MNTPVIDFLERYRRGGLARFHMPGHKGRPAGGLPADWGAWDITEVKGADALYESAGVIARGEANTAALFGARRTVWSTEGSSQCIKAMLCLAVQYRHAGTAPVVLAARNVHKSFVQAAALVGFEVGWLWPEGAERSLCACPVSAAGLERALAGLETPPCAVYLTSPDYLGTLQDIRALAEVAHRHGCLLLVDNAHGAYLHFLAEPCHPLELGADLCCDSAHKTLPVLTGGAYLHIGRGAPEALAAHAKQAMALFGSTSPSYLIMASLDGCNAWLAAEGATALPRAETALLALKKRLREDGWTLLGDEPLKLTLAAGPGQGQALADFLREEGVEPEYADPELVVLMASAHTTGEDLDRLSAALDRAAEKGLGARGDRRAAPPAAGRPARAVGIRQALLAPAETLSVEAALGRVCAAPTVACPPAIPIAVSGEVIDAGTVERFRYYGVENVDVIL